MGKVIEFCDTNNYFAGFKLSWETNLNIEWEEFCEEIKVCEFYS